MEYVEGDDMEEMDDMEDMEDFGGLISDGKDDLLKVPMWCLVCLEYFIQNFLFWLASVCQLPGFPFSQINDYIYIVIPLP
jgi:hypothetical protein